MPDRYESDALKARIDRALEQFVAHGKRLRAAFCYWGWRAVGQPDSDALVRTAASMELVHAAAVVHDDIIDNSPVRHGLPTAHVALRRVRHGRPRSRTVARDLAMLVGDLLVTLAGHMFVTGGLPAAHVTRARPLWADLARDLVAGECLEILRTGTAPDTDASLKVIRYKTAKYTVEQPLLIGGALAGAGSRLREAFSAYGLPLGEAFQLRDDLLGLFGVLARTGKANLDDLRSRRPTVLLAETWRVAGPAEREQLRSVLGRRALGAKELDEVRDVMSRLGAPARIENLISARVEQAIRALNGIGLPTHVVRALVDLSRTATDRRH
ncbi:polyprenyl synthetase family protein [Streptomyces sp. NBC_01433]|uniref:polyprenyl synthetase family protein n=1 Tax=Streptomyces sp. NBC_01433 TaxID=2903864 RepID=UPI002252A62C|nr:polyprenyl synthetase family protein [Streptomyces sp. NBC_01433]MCX4679361.1 polyprenyl synthetase family protein [Streptomyces sp. NBC_01433]